MAGVGPSPSSEMVAEPLASRPGVPESIPGEGAPAAEIIPPMLSAAVAPPATAAPVSGEALLMDVENKFANAELVFKGYQAKIDLQEN